MRCGGGGIFRLAPLTGLLLAGLIPALAVEALIQEKVRAPLRAFWLALLPVGFLVYMGINWAVAGSPLEFVDIQAEHFNSKHIWPWQFIEGTYLWIRDTESGFNRAIIFEARAVALIFAAALLIIGAYRRIPASYQVYGWVYMIFLMSSTWQISIPRYVLGLFPIFIVMAYLGRNQGVHQVIISASAALMGVFYVLYATSFGF